MTSTEIASAIRNRVSDGLSGNINNQAYSLEQLLEEIDLARADFAHKYANQGVKLNPKHLVQQIDTLRIECRNLSDDCAIKEPCGDVPSIKIPKLMSLVNERDIVQYLGLVNMQEDFAVYFHPDDIQNHRVRIRTRARPFVWVDLATDASGNQTIWFFNMGPFNPLQIVKLRAVFAQPTRVNLDDPNHLEKEYPAPLHMQNAIIDALTEKYVRYYRQMNIPPIPNQQNDPVT